MPNGKKKKGHKMATHKLAQEQAQEQISLLTNYPNNKE